MIVRRLNAVICDRFGIFECVFDYHLIRSQHRTHFNGCRKKSTDIHTSIYPEKERKSTEENIPFKSSHEQQPGHNTARIFFICFIVVVVDVLFSFDRSFVR